MNQTAVSLKNVSKKFRLFESPKDRLKEAFHPFKKKYHKEFWALKDISFEVPKGKTIGIIGRNGSGKSTLLQIICGVLKPTTGSVSVNGRISALLELGADFSPEFTGRENVLMKGIRTGLSKVEMNERLPEIENFADIGEFIDYPLKTYSSGMFVRLAFAAAINVDPDILIVDEALAVGDAAFQRKCYRKFTSFQEEGRTIILVTHDEGAITKHCDKVILLENAKIFIKDEPAKVIPEYWLILSGNIKYNNDYSRNDRNWDQNKVTNELTNFKNNILGDFLNDYTVEDKCHLHNNYSKIEHRSGDKRAEIIDFLIETEKQFDPVNVLCGKQLCLYIKIKINEDIENLFFGIRLKTIDGVDVTGFNTLKTQGPRISKRAEIIFYKIILKMNISEGDYFFNVGVSNIENGTYAHIDRRVDMIHIKVKGDEVLTGIAYLNHSTEELKRNAT
jgi:lipopolysaccharide transport system ATP-binding protein